MLTKIKNVYRQGGVKGLIFSSAAKILRKSGRILMDAGDHSALAAGNHRFFLTQIERTLLKRNRIFKDRHKGKRCFILGNGPSLKTQDLSPLANEITFAMSAFWKHPIVEKWQPTYYCFLDPFFFDASLALKEFFQSLNQKINHSTFLVPVGVAGAVRENGLLPLERTYYLAFHPTVSVGRIRNIDLLKRVPYLMGVSQLAIVAAIYMGCSEIYLLGHDHDWLSHQGLEQHFYEGYGGLEKHHEFHSELSHWSYKYLMECQLKFWRIYEKILALARRKGIRILNATNGGFLDLFERINYEDLMKRRI